MTPSLRLRLATWGARNIQRPILERAQSVTASRARVELAGRLFLARGGIGQFRTDNLGGVLCRVRPGAEGTLFYLHGGAYAMFSARTHQGVAAAMAKPLGLSAILPDYRRAPEAPFPAALDDAEAAYCACAERAPIVLAGDSAGGGLSLALLQRILSKGLPKPAAVVLFSPWADLTLSGETIMTNAEADPMLPVSRFGEVAGYYCGDTDPAHPEVSPVFGRYDGAPPVLVQVGDTEVLRSDSERVVAQLDADGAAATLDLIPGGLHAFQLLVGRIPEADAAVERAVAFAERALAARD